LNNTSVAAEGIVDYLFISRVERVKEGVKVAIYYKIQHGLIRVILIPGSRSKIFLTLPMQIWKNIKIKEFMWKERSLLF